MDHRFFCFGFKIPVSFSFIFLLFFLVSTLGAQPPPPVEDFFNTVKEKNQKNYPEQFSALLDSTVVNHQFKNIPQDAIELGKEPELYLKFKKSYAPILMVEHVSSFYANFFAPYEAIIQKSGLFLGIDNYGDYAKFRREYQFKIKKITEGYKVTIREIEALPGDYAEYFYRRDHSIFRAYFYEAKIKTGEIKFFYQEIDQKTFPKRIIIILHQRKQGGMNEFFVDFIRFKFDPLSGNIF